MCVHIKLVDPQYYCTVFVQTVVLKLVTSHNNVLAVVLEKALISNIPIDFIEFKYFFANLGPNSVN